MRKPARRIRTEPAPGADPTPSGAAPFLDDAELRDELPAASPGEDRAVDLGDEGVEVVADEADLGNRDRLEAERPPHYA